MKVGILETGTPPGKLIERFGRYDAMVERLIGEDHRYCTWRVYDGSLPARLDDAEAYLITGSPAGVHDGLPWIDRLAEFVRAARGMRPMVGICFGHQLLAHAFGGTVAKAGQGWGLGLHHYDIVGTAQWLDSGGSFRAIASHQDQVMVAPPDTAVIARSDFTPNAVLAYSDRSALSMQFHPEFTTEFARELTREMRAPDLSEDWRNAAVASLDKAADTGRVAGWIRRFLGVE